MRMQNVAAGVIALTAIAGVHPAAVAQQEDKKAVEVIAAARKPSAARSSTRSSR